MSPDFFVLQLFVIVVYLAMVTSGFLPWEIAVQTSLFAFAIFLMTAPALPLVMRREDEPHKSDGAQGNRYAVTAFWQENVDGISWAIAPIVYACTRANERRLKLRAMLWTTLALYAVMGVVLTVLVTLFRLVK